MRIFLVSYQEDGQQKERWFRDKRKADKFKKLKKGTVRAIYGEMEVLICT